MRFAAPLAPALVVFLGACGAREGLRDFDVPDASSALRDGGVAPDARVPAFDGGSALLDSGPETIDAGPRRTCSYASSFEGWTTVDAELGAAYRYTFGAVVDGRLRVLAEPNPAGPPHVLDLDVVEGVPAITARLVLSGPHFEPYGFAANGQHFVTFTREVATNAISMKVYDLAGNVTDERSFGIASFITATAALTDDGAVTLAATLLRDGELESVVERRTADGSIDFTETGSGRPNVTVALRGGRVELVRGDGVYEVTAGGITLRRAITEMGVVGPYSDGWFGITGDGADGLGFRFEPETGAAITYSSGPSSIGSSSSLLAVERSEAILWSYVTDAVSVLGVLREGAFRTYRAPMGDAPGPIPFAGPTDVGIFYGSGFAESPSVAPRPFRYWGLHCPE